MPNLDPWINHSENEQHYQTITEQEQEGGNSIKFENHLLSYRTECQKTIERNSHQHPTFLERYQKIIEMIDWTLERYRVVIHRNKIQQQQNESDLVIKTELEKNLMKKEKLPYSKINNLN